MEDSKEQAKFALPHLRELDGVRGIAVLLVFFHHVCFTSIQPEGWNSFIVLLYKIFRYGMSGVDVFFVLSGFLITSLLIRARRSNAYYRDFYWKRALRILPVYILCMLGVLFFIPGSRGYVLLCALFIANFANVFHVASVGPFWSLAIEEQFYLIWPTVVRRRSVETLWRWALAITILVWVLRLAAAAIGHHNYFLTFLRCDGLSIGAMIACRYQQKQNNLRSKGDALALSASMIVGTVFCALSGYITSMERHTAFGAAAEQTGIVLICAGAIGLVIAYTGHPALSPLRSAPLIFLGLISYALYMVQLYVIWSYDHLRGDLASGDTSAYFIRLLTVFAITIGVCLVSRYLIELPALSLRKRVLRHPTESVFHEPLPVHHQK
ncbi:MAG TPA: acyltransferase [Edaphobacter sp.]|nr:acyltransferase [Edaphobacter sp.]